MDFQQFIAEISTLRVPAPLSDEQLPESLREPLRPLMEHLETWRQFAEEVQGLAGAAADGGLEDRVEQVENTLRNVRGYGGVEVRYGPAGISIGGPSAKPQEEPLLAPTLVEGDADNEMLRWDETTEKDWVILDAPDTDFKVLQRKADDTLGFDYVRAH